MHQELLVGGYFIGGPCDSTVGNTQHYAPYDGRLVGTAAEAGWNELNAALDAAREAFATWRYSAKADRAALLRRISARVREESEDLALLMAQEIGKPLKQARGEVERLAITFELSAELAEQSHQRTFDVSYDARGLDRKVTSDRFPIGVVLAIVPYNWPYNLAAHKIGPALAAGNTVVVKAPSFGTLCTLRLGRLIHECGCPDGVVNVLNVPSQIAQRAVEDDRTAMLSFTGSPAVGWMLKGLIPRKRVALELGGDASAIIAPDADVDKAALELATAAFSYAGQICISLQHAVVHESIYDQFRDAFLSATSSLTVGDPLDANTDVGPVIDEANAKRILEWVTEAESQGCRVLTGGNRPGLVVEPTVVEGVTRDHRLGCEEVFGPVVTLQSYESDDQALDWLVRSQYGIHASLYTHDESRIERMYREVEVGGLLINLPPSLRFDSMPYGGVKNSGFGREGVSNTFHEMTDEKVLIR